ncbi:hypothetical protein [Streptomyces sp. NPDC006551]|uniref:hypothetical protein n=1 Tax=Streptomyces sp. NPDC006551 TaxID=3157178 RepID=UPI00339F1072
MADERYQWLDQEAAERLLRGEPVDPVDDHAREQAERLAQALASARPVPPVLAAEAELPGEAAALAAFRKATAERASLAASSPAPSFVSSPAGAPAPVAELDRVRVAAPLPTARRWGRSLRYGLAAAVAAVAVGGVAVAAGTGLLPRPFDDAPEPAASVTVADTPEPFTSDSPDDGGGTGTPSAPPGTGDGRSPGPSPSSSAPPATAGGTEGQGDGDPTPGRSADGSTKDAADLRAKTVKWCKDYRAGRLDDSDRQRLAGAAKKGESVSGFCDRVLAGGSAGASDSAATGGVTGVTGATGRTSGGDSSAGKDDDGSADGEGDRAGSAGGPAGSSGPGTGSTGSSASGGKGTGHGNSGARGARGSDPAKSRAGDQGKGPHHARKTLAAPVETPEPAAEEPVTYEV